MALARSALRARLADAIGGAEFSALTTSAQGGVAGATLIDTAQKGKGNDFCKGWWIVLTLGPTGSGSYEAREVDTFVASSGTYTPLVAFSAQVASGAVYELLRYNPSIYHRALDRAGEELFPYLYLPLRNETLVVDNLLSNWDFESALAAGAHPSWTNLNAPTVAAEATRVWHGSQAAKLTVNAGQATGEMHQAVQLNIHEVVGKTATLRARVWCDAASQARIRLRNTDTLGSSGWHGGASEWEDLEVKVAVTSSLTQLTAVLHVAGAGKIAYFDTARLWIDPVYRYTIPTSFRLGPHFVSQQYSRDYPSGPYYSVPRYGHPTAGHILRLEGMGTLTLPTTDTATVEVNETQANLLVAYAAMLMAEWLATDAASRDASVFTALATTQKEKVARLVNQPSSRMPPMSAEVPVKNWHVEEDSAGRYLIFDQVRS